MFLSVGLHLFVALLAICDFSIWFKEKEEKIISVPVMMIDLTNVPVTSMTNLPPKLGQKKESKSTKKSVKTSAYTRPKKKASSPAQKSKSSDTSLVVKKELDTVLDKILNKKEKKSASSLKKEAVSDPLQSLLASIDVDRTPLPEDIPEVEDQEILTEGIEGGQGGSYLRELSVSERDMLGLKLRSCWNIDAGVKGAQDMIVEIRAYLTEEGVVSDVKILNQSRYRKDPAFRSVAESARRAVYICADKKEESPFLMFPQRYGENYESWKTLLLRFNPLDGGIQ